MAPGAERRPASLRVSFLPGVVRSPSLGVPRCGRRGESPWIASPAVSHPAVLSGCIRRLPPSAHQPTAACTQRLVDERASGAQSCVDDERARDARDRVSGVLSSTARPGLNRRVGGARAIPRTAPPTDPRGYVRQAAWPPPSAEYSGSEEEEYQTPGSCAGCARYARVRITISAYCR